MMFSLQMIIILNSKSMRGRSSRWIEAIISKCQGGVGTIALTHSSFES